MACFGDSHASSDSGSITPDGLSPVPLGGGLKPGGECSLMSNTDSDTGSGGSLYRSNRSVVMRGQSTGAGSGCSGGAALAAVMELSSSRLCAQRNACMLHPTAAAYVSALQASSGIGVHANPLMRPGLCASPSDVGLLLRGAAGGEDGGGSMLRVGSRERMGHGPAPQRSWTICGVGIPRDPERGAGSGLPTRRSTAVLAKLVPCVGGGPPPLPHNHHPYGPHPTHHARAASCVGSSINGIDSRSSTTERSIAAMTGSVGSMGGIGGGGPPSLIAASFARMQGHLLAAEAAQVLGNGAAAAAAAAPGGAGEAVGGASGGASGPRAAAAPPGAAAPEQKQGQQGQQEGGPGGSSSDEGVVRAFAAAYLSAVRRGDAKWASDGGVQELLAQDVRLVAADGQRFVGRAAVVRRLNQGMEQFMKMVGQRAGGNAEPSAAGGDGGDVNDSDGDEANGGESSGSSGSAAVLPADSAAAAAPSAAAVAKMAKMAARLHASFEVQWATPSSERGAGGGGDGGGVAARARAWLARVVMLPGSQRRVLPLLRGGSGGSGGAAALQQPSPTPAAPSRNRPPRLLVVYSFRYGIRRMTVTDRLRVQGGAITSVRRTFKL